ncbi:hypothetical protein CH375_20285, partial [Leptospira ellisii]
FDLVFSYLNFSFIAWISRRIRSKRKRNLSRSPRGLPFWDFDSGFTGQSRREIDLRIVFRRESENKDGRSPSNDR